MSRIRPKNPRLLTEQDVDYDPFTCESNRELVFLRCPACTHIMVWCYECDTLYPDLRDPSQQIGIGLTRVEQRLACPACHVPFEDFYFLQRPYVDKYLPTAEQVITAGFGHLMSPEKRREFDLGPS